MSKKSSSLLKYVCLFKFQGNGQVFEACVNRLTATQKQALSNVLSGAVAPVSNKAG